MNCKCKTVFTQEVENLKSKELKEFFITSREQITKVLLNLPHQESTVDYLRKHREPLKHFMKWGRKYGSSLSWIFPIFSQIFKPWMIYSFGVKCLLKALLLSMWLQFNNLFLKYNNTIYPGFTVWVIVSNFFQSDNWLMTSEDWLFIQHP